MYFLFSFSHHFANTVFSFEVTLIRDQGWINVAVYGPINVFN